MDILDKSDPNRKNRYGIWLKQAQYDLQAAKNSFEDGNYEWVCYQTIQSVEKVLKAVVVQAGFRPPKTHKLGVLISMANRANELFKDVQLKAFRKIESYTFISRYPFVAPGNDLTPHDFITKNDAIACLEIANDITDKVVSFIKSHKPTEKLIEFEEYYFTDEEVDSRISEIKDALTTSLELKVHQIYIFGSFANKSISKSKTTTMDVLVIADTTLPFIERIQYVREITKGSVPIVEPLIYTPAEFDTLLNEEGEGFLESALESSLTIYKSE